LAYSEIRSRKKVRYTSAHRPQGLALAEAITDNRARASSPRLSWRFGLRVPFPDYLSGGISELLFRAYLAV
jgi:hypothetical protein